VNRVAVITDIHANLPALEATLAQIDDLDVDAVYCGGDLVRYGPHRTRSAPRSRPRAIPTIYGN
jgi:predicted phosphodiesterase